MLTPTPGLLIAAKYELERPLAKGGMGAVWVAKHRDLGTSLAIKFMDAAFVASGTARARFEREAKAVAGLSSQHIVNIYDYGVEDETPYMAMELLRGQDLSKRLKRGRIALPEAETFVTQICKALRTAHEAGLVHRDLKPANIFLAQKDSDEVIKVLDFGIAKDTGAGTANTGTQTGALLGSIHYMSPEQTRSAKDADLRSDLWSLGIILFRALAGQLPFAGDDLGDVILKICIDPIPLPSQVAPDLPAALDPFFQRVLARDPGERFQSAIELAEAFQTLVREVGGVTAERPLSSPSLSSSSTQLAIVVPQTPAPESDRVSVFAATASAEGEPTGTLAPTNRTMNTPGTRGRRAIVWAGGGLVLLAAVGLGLRFGSGRSSSAGTASSSLSMTVAAPTAGTSSDTTARTVSEAAPPLKSSEAPSIAPAPGAPTSATPALSATPRAPPKGELKPATAAARPRPRETKLDMP